MANDNSYTIRRIARIGGTFLHILDAGGDDAPAAMMCLLRSALAIYSPSSKLAKNIERDVMLTESGLHHSSVKNDITYCALTAKHARTLRSARHRLLSAMLTYIMRQLEVDVDDCLVIRTDHRGRVLILKVYWQWVPTLHRRRVGVECHVADEYIAHDTHCAWVSACADAHANEYVERASKIISYATGRW